MISSKLEEKTRWVGTKVWIVHGMVSRRGRGSFGVVWSDGGTVSE